jgi:hypothetical protein
MTDHRFTEGLWRCGAQGVVMVPANDEPRDAIIHEAHNIAACGHLGMNATLDRLLLWFSWKHGDQSMKQHVEAYIRSCDMCQRNKSSSHKPAGLLQPLPVPNGAWTSIGVDFATGLPMSVRGLDMLMFVVDRFTKQVHLVPTAKNLNAEGCC